MHMKIRMWFIQCHRFSVRAKQTIPIVTILIIVANVIAAIMCIGIENTFQLAGINYEYITINHEYRRLISYMFIHADLSI